MSLPQEKSQRIETLEGLRGLAAIVVFFFHWILGFLPQLSGIFPNFPKENVIVGKLGLFFLNGAGAVVFFFVLSGFVLSRRSILNNNSEQIGKNFLKRWPRLAFPTTVAAICSWILFRFNLYNYHDAALITKSPWLASFASASPVPVDHSIWDALTQGLFYTFYRGDSYYDSSMWTMHYEFLASLLIFGTTLLIISYKNSSKLFPILSILIISIILFMYSPWYPPFLFGLLLAYVLPEKSKINKIGNIFIFVFGLYLLGFYSEKGMIIFGTAFAYQYVDMIGSMLLIISCYDIVLTPKFSKCAKMLGEISFPFYLLHVLVICSFGSWFYITLKGYDIPHASFISCLVTLFSTILISVPFIVLNNRWVNLLNYWISLIGKKNNQY